MDKTMNANPPVSKQRKMASLRAIGGSKIDDWNSVVANQVMSTSKAGGEAVSQEDKEKLQLASLAPLLGSVPQDELEGMLIAQMSACHNASMECFRLAMVPEQSFEARHANLNQGAKLTKAYAAGMEALNRHRGKANQKVTVEHVHVHAGGQAVVGVVEGGRGLKPIGRGQPHAKLSNTHKKKVRSQDEEWGALPVTCDV